MQTIGTDAVRYRSSGGVGAGWWKVGGGSRVGRRGRNGRCEKSGIGAGPQVGLELVKEGKKVGHPAVRGHGLAVECGNGQAERLDRNCEPRVKSVVEISEMVLSASVS
jgi:hypothetical protein